MEQLPINKIQKRNHAIRMGAAQAFQKGNWDEFDRITEQQLESIINESEPDSGTDTGGNPDG